MGLALMAVAHAENGVHSPQIFYLNTGELQTSSVHICCKPSQRADVSESDFRGEGKGANVR